MIVLLRLSAGLIAWAVAFCAIYGLHGITCAVPASSSRAILIAAWAVAVAVNIAVALWLSRTARSRLDRAATATGWVGVAASVVTFAPIVIAPVCI